MLNNCTIVIITQCNPTACNCYNETQNPLKKIIMTFDI